MNEFTKYYLLIINKIKCRFRYHKYYIIQEITPWSRKIGCKRCNKFFGMNDDVRVVIEWTEELEEIYKIMGVLLYKINNFKKLFT